MDAQGQGLTDKIDIHNIFKAPHGGGGYDGGSNTWAAILPALMGERNVNRGPYDGGYGWGGGAGALGGLATGFFGGLVGNALFRGGLGGFEDGRGRHGGDSCAGDVERAMIVQDIGELKRDVATSANETQAVVNAVGANGVQTTLQQTIALQQALAGLAASTQSGFCTVEREIASKTNLLSVEILNSRAQAAELACSIKGVVHEEGEKTRALLTRQYEDSLNRRIEEQNAKIVALETEGRFAEQRRQSDAISTRIDINNTAVAAQAQGQQQAQFQELVSTVRGLVPAVAGLTQIAHATNSNVIAGNSGPVLTGTQTANPTNVRA